jgi:hypothetical protein
VLNQGPSTLHIPAVTYTVAFTPQEIDTKTHPDTLHFLSGNAGARRMSRWARSIELRWKGPVDFGGRRPCISCGGKRNGRMTSEGISVFQRWACTAKPRFAFSPVQCTQSYPPVPCTQHSKLRLPHCQRPPNLVYQTVYRVSLDGPSKKIFGRTPCDKTRL